MRALLPLLFALPLVTAIGIETVDYDGSAYFWINGTGSISPFILINKSSGDAQISTAETYDFQDALSRQDWLTFKYGFSRYNDALKRFIGQGSDDLSQFTEYAFTDSATYWRTEANGSRDIGGRNLSSSLKHSQRLGDDFINETWEVTFNTNITTAFDLWYVESLTNVSGLDHVTFGNGTHITGGPFNSTVSYYMDNVTSFSIANATTGRGWQYLFDVDQFPTKLAIYNGTVRLGINLGRTLRVGTKTWSLQKIDANPCQIQCQAGDAVSISGGLLSDPGTQVPVNVTTQISWDDISGTCSLVFCALAIQETDPYNVTTRGYQQVNGSRTVPPGSSWLSCNMEDADNNCPVVSGLPLAIVESPTKGTFYYHNLTEEGRYNRFTVWQAIFCLITTPIINPHNDCLVGEVGDAVTLVDNTAPQLFPPQPNNTRWTIPSTNGSLTHANLSLSTFITDTGLVNNTCVWLNWTGTWACNDVVDYWQTLNTTVILVNTSAAYRECYRANDTQRNSNFTCFVFWVSIVPPPVQDPFLDSWMFIYQAVDSFVSPWLWWWK